MEKQGLWSDLSERRADSRRAGTSSVRGSPGVHPFLCYSQDHNVSGIIRGLPSRPTQAKVVEASHIR